MSKGHFIVLTHFYTPNKEDPSKHSVTEKCEFVDRLKNRYLTDATVIIDAVKKTVVKTRTQGATYEEYIAHITKTHPDEYAEFEKYLVVNGVTKPKFEDTPIVANGDDIVVA